jgi:excisionase family DNA binding protein
MEPAVFNGNQHFDMQCLIDELRRLAIKEEPLVYTVEQTAAKLQISKSKAYELARRNDFPSVKIGGRVMVPRRKLEEWINNKAEV